MENNDLNEHLKEEYMGSIIEGKKREYGYYWIKHKEDGWIIAIYSESWGIPGWWGCGSEYAFYDEDIVEIGERLIYTEGL